LRIILQPSYKDVIDVPRVLTLRTSQSTLHTSYRTLHWEDEPGILFYFVLFLFFLIFQTVAIYGMKTNWCHYFICILLGLYMFRAHRPICGPETCTDPAIYE